MFPLNLSPTVKLVLGGIFAAVIPLLQYLLKVEPGFAWIAPLLSLLLYVDGLLTVPSAASRKMAAMAEKIAKPLGMVALVVLAGLTQAACLSSAPVVPVTPQNQAQVSSCENSSTVHNVSVLSGIGLGVAGATMGSIAPFESDQGVKNGLAGGAAASAALAGGAATIAAFAAQNFANSHCTDVVGPLPAKPGNAASGWPADWPEPRTVTIEQRVDSARSVVRAVGFVQQDGTTVEVLKGAGGDQ